MTRGNFGRFVPRNGHTVAVLAGLMLLLGVAEICRAAEPAPQAAPASAPPGFETKVLEWVSSQDQPYRIFLARPQAEPPRQGFPVIYVLDGNAYFEPTLEAYRQAEEPLPPAVIVGIGYPTDERFDRVRRTFDLTTPASPEKLPPTRIPGGWPKGGGADAFLDLLENELKPRIAKEVRVDPRQQTLLGHSFGGLFVMHTLFTRPQTFQNYVAISPSGWWNDYALLEEERQFADKAGKLDQPVRLLIAVGELELADDQGPAAALEPTPAKKAFGSTRDFAHRLLRLKAEPLKIEYWQFAGKNHGSVVPDALRTAVPFVLSPSPGRP